MPEQPTSDSPEVSVVMPCLNEAETVAVCIQKACACLADNGVSGEIIVADNGSIFVADGHGDDTNNRVVKFSSNGSFIKAWGQSGYAPGEFRTLHAIALGSRGRIFVGDRSNNRIQIFDPKGNFITMWNNIHRPDAMVLWQDHIYVGELNGMAGVDDAPGLGHRVTVYDLNGQRVCIFGAAEEGEGPGQFIAPHGIAVDSKGAIYVGEVSFTIRGSKMDPPRALRSLSKYDRKW